MNIGLYFGSFNPVHAGHLIIANELLNSGNVQKLWFVLSPRNPFKESKSLLDEYDRLHLLKLAVDGDERIRVSDAEFSLPRPSFTSVTLLHLTEKYPEHQFSLIIGGDSLLNFASWKNAGWIAENYPILVYPRPGFERDASVVNGLENAGKPVSAKISFVSAPLLQISSTEIRNLIRGEKSIRYLLPDAVREEILLSGYYK